MKRMFHFIQRMEQIQQKPVNEQGDSVGLATTSIQDRVSRHYADLSPQMQRAAQFLVDYPDEIATHSLRQIAHEAQLPPPTFSRLARALGCDSYEMLRDMCRDEIRRRKSHFADKALALLDLDAGDAVAGRGPYLVRQAAAAMSNIQALLENTDMAALEDAAQRLAQARHVVLIGTLSSYAFIDYVSYLAGMGLPNWSVIGRGGSSMSSGVVGLGEEDAAIVVAKDPAATRSVHAARLAFQNGAYVLAITDTPHSPLLRNCSSSVTISTTSPLFFTSHVAALVLLEALMGMVVRAKGAHAQQRIAEVEKQNHLLGEYWQD